MFAWLKQTLSLPAGLGLLLSLSLLWSGFFAFWKWTRPLGTWQLGERLLDAHVLPPPGDTPTAGWSFRVGLYDPDTSERLPAYDPAGTRLPDDYTLVSLDQ